MNESNLLETKQTNLKNIIVSKKSKLKNITYSKPDVKNTKQLYFLSWVHSYVLKV